VYILFSRIWTLYCTQCHEKSSIVVCEVLWSLFTYASLLLCFWRMLCFIPHSRKAKKTRVPEKHQFLLRWIVYCMSTGENLNLWRVSSARDYCLCSFFFFFFLFNWIHVLVVSNNYGPFLSSIWKLCAPAHDISISRNYGFPLQSYVVHWLTNFIWKNSLWQYLFLLFTMQATEIDQSTPLQFLLNMLENCRSIWTCYSSLFRLVCP
jgi:hypothetical protein